DRETERLHDRHVGRQRPGAGDRNSRASMTALAAIVIVVELPHGARPRRLDGLQRRPLRQKVARLDRGEIADPVERLWKILFQQAGEPVAQRHALMDQFSALFTERLQHPAVDGIGTHTRSLSRWRTTRSRSSSESCGSCVAPLVVNGSRYRASALGLIGYNAK